MYPNMKKEQSLEENLKELSRQINQLPEIQEPPRTTLQVLSFDHLEKYWNRLLTYFLNSQNPHGFDSKVLEVFLDTISKETDFEYSKYQLQNVRVQSEVETQDGNRADLLLFPEDKEWFIWAELKVRSSEIQNQTKKYVEDSHIGNEKKSESDEDRHHYVYISKDSESDRDEFSDISWETFVQNFENISLTAQSHVPFVSVSQFSQFLTTMKEEIGMSKEPYQENQEQKRKLYLKYYQEIDEAREAFKNFWEHHKNNWKENFLEKYGENLSDEWRLNSNKYGQIYQEGWYLDENVNEATPDDCVFRLHFIHRIRDFSSFRDGQIVFQLKAPKQNNFRKTFSENLDEVFEENCKNIFNDHEIEDKRRAKVKTEKVYKYNINKLPDSYYKMLFKAVKEHETLVEHINSALSKTKEQFKEKEWTISDI